MEEIWKDITGYEGLYQVSNFGNIKSLKYRRTNNEKILKLKIDNTGYYKVDLYKNKVRKSVLVHQIIAQEFLGHIINKYTYVINHIDGVKLNNALDNLEIVTNRYNTSDGFIRLNKTSKYTGVSWNKKCQKWQSDIQFKGKGYYLGIYLSEEIASNVYNIALSCVNNNTFETFYLEEIKTKKIKDRFRTGD